MYFGALLLEQLDAMVACAKALPAGPDRRARLVQDLAEIHLRSLAAHGPPIGSAEARELLALDLELNAQGIDIWLARTEA